MHYSRLFAVGVAVWVWTDPRRAHREVGDGQRSGRIAIAHPASFGGDERRTTRAVV